MSVLVINWIAELKKLATGKPTKIPAREIAILALPWAEAGLRNRDEEELERLFNLPDTREDA